MGTPRERIDARLRKVLQETTGTVHLYYQPPANLRMQYPCIRYTRSKIRNQHANDGVYAQHWFYTVTVLDTDPDSKIVPAVAALPKCSYDRDFVSDGLYQTVFTIYD